ncbi:hypothetical protein [Rhizobium paknamense]|uniref:Uncharacterized protein n=1 Tax=Rhizobium paknamense TaxID=1206817 RepID=A0ABU0IA87_9HYPH|nr:hypothetical protein [Rhizobium paknamense]MDQ0455144.1 hypothetical protein [Rhizobium paknamense]
MSELDNAVEVTPKKGASAKDRLKNASDYAGAINRMIFLWGSILFCVYCLRNSSISFLGFNYNLDYLGFFAILSVVIYLAIVLWVIVRELVIYTFSVSLGVLPLMSEEIWRSATPTVRVKWTWLTIFFSIMLAGLLVASLKFLYLIVRNG